MHFATQSVMHTMKDKMLSLFSVFDSPKLRGVVTLVGGSAFGQLIMLSLLPVLTRIYTPDDFSILSFYVSALAILASVSCLRFEIAIPLPQDDAEGYVLLKLALISSLALSSFSGFVLLAVCEIFGSVPAVAKYKDHLWLLPVGMFFLGGYTAFLYWANRKKRFSTIAKTRVLQALGGGGVQVGLGVLGAGPIGLLLGHAVYGGAGFLSIAKSSLSEFKKYSNNNSAFTMAAVFKKYDRFPKYSTFESFANISGIQLPIILIAMLAVGPEAGLLMLAMKVMQGPMSLIGSSVGQVYLSHGAAAHRDGNIASLANSTLSGLLKVGVGPLIFAGIVASEVFSVVFGPEWRASGEMAAWITPWLVFQFLASPISMTMHIQEQHRKNLGLTIFGLLIRVGAVLVSVVFYSDMVVQFYAVSSAAFYLVCLWIFGYHSGLNFCSVLSLFRGCIVIVACWVFLAVVIKCFFIFYGRA